MPYLLQVVKVIMFVLYFTDDKVMDIKKGRHPIMDKILKDHKYVANDGLF